MARRRIQTHTADSWLATHQQGKLLSTPIRERIVCPARRGQTVVSASSNTGTRVIPIFPLNVVAMPASTVYLNIFEARYRVLFSTLLAGSQDLEEGLVDHDSPFCGSREFGMCFVGQNGGVCSIGTLLRIEEHVRLDDGRLQIVNKGLERFKVVNVQQEKPVLICEVEFLEQTDEPASELEDLRAQVAELCRNNLKLSGRFEKSDVPASALDPPQLQTLGPHDLSFWVAFNFFPDVEAKQQLLETDSTVERLKKEQEVLQGNLNYLSAASAIRGAFKDDVGTS